MIGYKPEELTDNDYEWSSRVHPEDLALTFAEISKSKTGQTDSFTNEYRFRNKDGNYIWILNRGKVVERNAIGEATKIVGTHTNISEFKKTEELIKINETRLLLAAKAGGVGIWDWDIVNDQLSWDDQMFVLYGVNRSQFKNAYEAWVNGVYEADKQRGDHEIQLAMKGEKDFNTEFRVQHENGEIRYIKALATVLRDEEGTAIRMIGTNWDITSEKEALAQISAKEEAEKANKAKSDFLANMSHEIRTPLNSVIGFTDLLKKTELSAIQQQYLNSANIAGHALLGLINDILDFSKIEAGMLELDVVKSDLVQIFEDSIDIIKFAASEKDIELLLDIDTSMPRFAFVDAIRLKQILTNLLGNAVKFTISGEIELKINYKASDDPNGTLSISVRDTGIGIHVEEQDKLFKSFSQADSSTTRKFGGTGLGLVISQLIAEKMGSVIKIRSTVGIGTVFYFDISTRFEDGEKPDTKKIKGIKRCLIIDDNANNRIIMKQMLNQWQIHSECCDSGFEALKAIEQNKRFDLIICDHNMPIINGLETIRMLKNKFILSTEKMPVILLHSSLDNMQLEKECSDLGIRFRLSKPVKSNDLFNYLCHVNQEDAISLKNEPSTIPKRKNSYEGIKILIAEDVFLNMVLIKAMITELGFNVEVIEAKNGKEAIEKYQEFSPDLILMDVHMPELNGINATKKIREIELLSGNAVPIIALTAGALKEEREKCFENGMNDFLTKPLVPEKIMEMLETYLAKGSSKIKGNQTVEPNNESHLAFQELANLFDSKSTLRDVLIIALNDLPAQILQLEEACIEKHAGKIKEAAHIIRGSSSSMRFGLMAQIAEKIENESKDVWVEALESYLSELKNEWEIVKKIIQKFIH